MNDLLGRHTPVGIFVVIKPSRLLVFVVVWNLIGGAGIYLNGGMGKFTDTRALAAWLVDFTLLCLCSVLLLASQTVRDRWCRPGADFGKAALGLVFVTVIGLGFVFGLAVELLALLA
ncbi:MAG: hypothetical protein ACYS9X_06130 [Planctomycetota bacterium]